MLTLLANITGLDKIQNILLQCRPEKKKKKNLLSLENVAWMTPNSWAEWWNSAISFFFKFRRIPNHQSTFMSNFNLPFSNTKSEELVGWAQPPIYHCSAKLNHWWAQPPIYLYVSTYHFQIQKLSEELVGSYISWAIKDCNAVSWAHESANSCIQVGVTTASARHCMKFA